MFSSAFNSLILIRMLSVVMAALSVFLFDFYTLTFLVTIMAFAHTIVGLMYSKRQLHYTFSSRYGMATLLILFAVSQVIAYYDWPGITLIFVIHHILTEQYIVRKFGKQPESDDYPLFFIRLMMNMSVCAPFLGGELDLSLMLFGASLLLYTVYLVSFKKHPNALSMISFEFLQVFLLVVFLSEMMVFAYALLVYHFVFWFFLPLSLMKRQERRGYYGWNILWVGLITGCYLCFYSIYSVQPRWEGIDPKQWVFGDTIPLYWVAYTHIILSLQFSDLNPTWLNRLFQNGGESQTIKP